MRAFARNGAGCAALAACLLAAGCGTAADNSGTAPAGASRIVNGSFEQPAVAAGGATEFAVGQAFAGWRVVGAPGSVAIVSDSYRSGGITFNARAGKQWMDLTGDESNTVTGVACTFASAPGTAYHLTFWVGNVYDPGGIFGVSSTVQVYVNGVRKLTATNSLHPAGTQAWKEFALAIKATSGHTTISFINGDPGTDNSNGLDAVAVS
jgi:hypothetical protein